MTTPYHSASPAHDSLAAGRPAVPGVTLGEELGRGARTVVFRGTRAGADYAIKMLAGVVDGREATEFRREAARLARLDHPGLVRVHEVGDVDGRPYLIMDLVDGRSLRAALRAGPLPQERVLAVALRVTDALTAAHSAGLVHRDIKPDNVMLAADGAAYLIDFGLAGHAGERAGDAAVGTFAYSAPEQTGVLHRAVDGRADLYALGVVLFECLAGTVPFAAADPGEMIQLHMTCPAPDLRTLVPAVAPSLAAVVARLLAKDPDDRYAGADGLHADLSRIAAGAHEVFPLDAATGLATGEAGPLVGRDEELARLRESRDELATGTGGAVLMLGPPGIGKTRLAAELTAGAGPVLRGSAGQDSAVPLRAVRAAIDGYVEKVDRLPEPDREAAVARLRAAAGETAALLQPLSPALARALGATGAPVGDDRRFAEAVAGLLANLAAAEGGAVLHLDDMQWCDDATRRVLRRLGPLLATSPLLVVVGARTGGDAGPDAVADARAGTVAGVAADLGDAVRHTVELGPLADAAVAELVAADLGAARVPAPLVARFATRGGGNPLAVREYVRAILDAGLLRPAWGDWLLDEAGLDVLDLPVDVLHLFLRRAAGLDAAARRLLTIGAVAGDRFPYQMIVDIGGAGGRLAGQALAEAVEQRLVEAAGDGGFGFVHREVREALLERLDPAEGAALHRRVAYWLAATGDERHVYEIARHYLLGDPVADPEPALRAAAAAGARALDEHAPAEAFAYLGKAAAVALDAGVELDAGFYADLGRAAVGVNAYDEAREYLGRALERERDPMRRARLYAHVAMAHHLRWAGEAAYEAAQRGLAELGRAIPRHPLALVATTLGTVLAAGVVRRLPAWLRLATGARRERYQLLCHLLGMAAQSMAIALRPARRTLVDLRGSLAAVRLGPGPEAAWKVAGSAVGAAAMGRVKRRDRLVAVATELADRLPDPGPRAMVYWLCGLAIDVVPPFGQSRGRWLRAVMDRHGRWLDLTQYLTGAGVLGLGANLRGYPDEAMEWYRRAMARVNGEADALSNPFSAIPAHAAALAGRPVEARAVLRRLGDHLRSTPDNPAAQLTVAAAAVHVAVELGDLDEAFEPALAEFLGFPRSPAEMWPYQTTAWVAQAAGRLEQAYAGLDRAAPPDPARLAAAGKAVTELRRVAKGPGMGAFHEVARGGLAVVSGRPAAALPLLAAAQERARGRDMPLLEYEVSRWRARAHRALGEVADARRQAEYALHLATSYGWVNRAIWIRTEFDLSTVSTARGRMTQSAAGSAVQQRRLQALHDVSRAAATVLEPAELTRVALDEIVRIFAAERAFVFLADGVAADAEPGGLRPYLGRDVSGADLAELTGYGSTLVDRAYATGEALVVTGSDEGRALGSQSALVHGLRSIMVAPLTVNAQTRGVVYLDSRAAKGIFTTDDVDLLQAIANHVALALETARAAQLKVAVSSAQRERDTAQLLHSAMAEVAASLDPEDVIQRLLASTVRSLPGAVVVLLHRRTDEWLEVVRPGVGGAGPAAAALLEPAGDPVLTGLLAGGRATTGTGPAPGGALADLLGPAAGHWLAVPLAVRAEQRGLLLAGRARPFSEAEIGVIAALASQGVTALDNALLFRQVQELAAHDGLTRLFNRRHFYEVAEPLLAASRRDQRPVAAIMVDIDRFKAINDAHGHGVGDEVIRVVGDRLSQALRQGDLFCRYGGEEFAALLTDVSTEQALAVAQRLNEVVREAPVDTAAGPLAVTVSVGLAGPALSPDDLPDLLDTADTALYRAKREGRNRVIRTG